MPTALNGKQKYVVLYRNLKLYFELWNCTKKIRRVHSFSQSAWIAPFINFNTEKKNNAKKFENDFFKLMNNATNRKSVENVRSRNYFKFVNNEKQLIKWTANRRICLFCVQ